MEEQDIPRSLLHAAQAIPIAISLSGVAVLVGVERALTRSLDFIERDLFVEPLFSAVVLVVAALGVFLVVFGVGSAGVNTARRTKLFVVAESPIALFVGTCAATYLNVFRILTDAGPRNPVDLSSDVPVALLVFVRPLLFYSILTALLVATIAVFVRRTRSVV